MLASNENKIAVFTNSPALPISNIIYTSLEALPHDQSFEPKMYYFRHTLLNHIIFSFYRTMQVARIKGVITLMVCLFRDFIRFEIQCFKSMNNKKCIWILCMSQSEFCRIDSVRSWKGRGENKKGWEWVFGGVGPNNYIVDVR